jgi:hypothetical protein
MARPQALTDEQIATAVAMKDDGIPLAEIAYQLGTSYGMAAQIIHKHKTGGYRRTLSEWIAHRDRMVWLIDRGVTVDEVSKMYRAEPEQIASIVGLREAA